jgi:hypothetical protein
MERLKNGSYCNRCIRVEASEFNTRLGIDGTHFVPTVNICGLTYGNSLTYFFSKLSRNLRFDLFWLMYAHRVCSHP